MERTEGSGVNFPLKGVKGKELNWVSESAKEPNKFPALVWVGAPAVPRLESPLDVHIKFPL